MESVNTYMENVEYKVLQGEEIDLFDEVYYY